MLTEVLVFVSIYFVSMCSVVYVGSNQSSKLYRDFLDM